MIQHMNLVFKAEGLSVGEGAFLLACCNHTDDRGYVIASMQQLADESHMTERNARNNKQRLIKRGLLAAADRYHPKTRARIADLYRVNLDLLGRMQRKRTDYGPTVIEELTFAASEETAGQTPRKILPPPPEDFAAPPEGSSAPPENPSGTPPEGSAPLLLPSSSSSSLSQVTADADGASGTATDGREREAATPDASVPEPRAAEPEAPAERVARVWSEQRAALGVVTSPARVKTLVKEAGWLLAKGLPVELLEAEATLMASEPTWLSLVKHMENRKPAESAGGRERCPDHPARYRKGCLDCAMAVPV